MEAILSRKDNPALFKGHRGEDHFLLAERITDAKNASKIETLKEYFSVLFSIPEKDRANLFLCFDFETNTMNGYAVSFGAAMLDLKQGEIVSTASMLFNPIDPIDEEAMKVHGISEEKIKNAPFFSERLEEILSLILSADCLVAHNAMYDIGVLVREFERASVAPFPKLNFMDTMSRVKKTVKAKGKTGRLKDATLEDFASFYGVDVSGVKLHDSMEDALLLAKTFLSASQR